MAVGPEQLDIKKLAKIFLLKGDVANALNKEIIMELIREFGAEDWEYIREHITDTTFKRELRNAIDECRIELTKIGENTSTLPGSYPKVSYEILEKAIAIATNIMSDPYLYSNLNEGELETYLRDTAESLRELTEKILLTENERFEIYYDDVRGQNICLSNNRIVSTEKDSKNENDLYTWQPAKVLRIETANNDNIPNYIVVSPEDINFNLGHNYIPIKGLFLKDVERGKNVIITRQQTYLTKDNDNNPVERRIADLNIPDVEIVQGVLTENDMLIVEVNIPDADKNVIAENVDYAALASSYLCRPVNAVPVKFGSDINSMEYEKSYELLLKHALKIEENANLQAALKGDHSYLIKDVLNVKDAASVKPIDSSKSLFLNSILLSAKQPILVDTRNRVITGLSVKANATIDKIEKALKSNIVMNNGTLLDKVVISGKSSMIEATFVRKLTNEQGVGEIVREEKYIIMRDNWLVDQQEDRSEISNKSYSKYPVANLNYNWIPSVLVKGAFITLETPLAGEYKLYSENDSMVHINGFVINDTLYTRYDKLELQDMGLIKIDIDDEVEKLRGRYKEEGIKTDEQIDQLVETHRQRLLIENLSRPFYYKEAAYYNGYLFGSRENLKEDIDEIKYYFKNLPYFRLYPEQLEGKNGDEPFFIESDFRDLTYGVNVASDNKTAQFWYGTYKDAVHLPNNTKDCKDYLNIVAYKTKPEDK